MQEDGEDKDLPGKDPVEDDDADLEDDEEVDVQGHPPGVPRPWLHFRFYQSTVKKVENQFKGTV